ncbi:MAG: hypothetical protein KatS3mg059_0982 [Thermomicrobiales bacterium]|nr:MAG: hypothetical protein KatS3mg059_0982 [Thermomicrobiales bacterium]
MAGRAWIRHSVPPGTAPSPQRIVRKPETLSVRLVIAADRAIYRLARRWLFLVNSIFVAWATTIFLAPWLAAHGHTGLARPLYAFNGLFCHQRPDRSFFLWGHQLACCQRCAAIYCSLAVFGIVFAGCRTRIRRPAWPLLAAATVLLALDGLTQLAGPRESTPLIRVVTGALLGLGICSVLLPYLESGFASMRAQIEHQFARLAATGRARPLS